jgi:acyl-coenzyme A thioesterase 13
VSPMQVPPNCDLTLGIVCLDKSVPGVTRWAMTADERFANPAGVIQGGLLGAFADSAMGASAVTFATSESKGRVFCANVEMKTSFVKPVTAGTALTCVARVVSGGGRVVFCEAEIRNPDDRLVATASSTYLIDPRAC